MALEDMTSIFQPKEIKEGNGLAEGKGLASVGSKASDLDIDVASTESTGLANGQGLEKQLLNHIN